MIFGLGSGGGRILQGDNEARKGVRQCYPMLGALSPSINIYYQALPTDFVPSHAISIAIISVFFGQILKAELLDSNRTIEGTNPTGPSRWRV